MQRHKTIFVNIKPSAAKYKGNNKHIYWHILSIDISFKETFNNLQPMAAFRKNTSLKQRTEINLMRKKETFLTLSKTTTTGQFTLCSTTQSLCCRQFLKTITFTSTQTRKASAIFHLVTCNSNYVICFLECIMCKTQYVAKSETSFNIRLNNHRKGIKQQNP